jgi:hypothetical protein
VLYSSPLGSSDPFTVRKLRLNRNNLWNPTASEGGAGVHAWALFCCERQPLPENRNGVGMWTRSWIQCSKSCMCLLTHPSGLMSGICSLCRISENPLATQ